MIKKISSLVLVFLVLFSSFSLPVLAVENEYKYGIVDAKIGINVRDGAGTNYKVIGNGIVDRQAVTIYETVTSTSDNDTCQSHIWYKIKYLQVEQGYGYACSDFIKILDIEEEFDAVLMTFPESYREQLKLLHAIYPNAVFRVYNVGLDFNEVVSNEAVEGKNLLWDTNNSRDGLKNFNTYNVETNSFKNNYAGGGKNWYAPNEETIAYYIDPRNFLNETGIFMFESLSYNSMHHNISGVESILKSSFMYNTYVDNKTEKKFSDVIMTAGITYGISPYYIASRILQETGTSRSALVLGTYPNYPAFNGYYNFYNYGAGGNDVIFNGLAYAYDKGWNSEEKSIIGGASLIGTNYISVGQDTNYFQKWDVICESKYSSIYNTCSYYKNQYMQNIEAPFSEALHTYNGYKSTFGNDMHDVSYVFTIPVYENMPDKTTLPSSLSPVNYLSDLTINGKTVTNFEKSTTSYSITIPSNVKSIKVGATAVKSGTNIKGIGDIEIKSDKQIIPITVSALNGNVRTYNITVNLNDDINMTLTDTLNGLSNKITDNYIIGFSTIEKLTESILNVNSAAIIKIKNNDIDITSGTLATGYKVIIEVGNENKEFEVVIYGDNNGDGKISAVDYVRIKNYIMGNLKLDGVYSKAADVNKDGKISAVDYVNIKNYIMGNNSTIKN